MKAGVVWEAGAMAVEAREAAGREAAGWEGAEVAVEAREGVGWEALEMAGGWAAVAAAAAKGKVAMGEGLVVETVEKREVEQGADQGVDSAVQPEAPLAGGVAAGSGEALVGAVVAAELQTWPGHTPGPLPRGWEWLDVRGHGCRVGRSGCRPCARTVVVDRIFVGGEGQPALYPPCGR